jgi:hypothetical protein
MDNKTVDEAKKVEMSTNYILYAKTLMLVNVLKQSKKVVFNSELKVG